MFWFHGGSQTSCGCGGRWAARAGFVALAANDLLHFTQPGYERAGDMFLQALDAAALDAMAH